MIKNLKEITEIKEDVWEKLQTAPQIPIKNRLQGSSQTGQNQLPQIDLLSPSSH